MKADISVDEDDPAPDYLQKARRWLEGDKWGSVSGANATQVTLYALLSIATDIRKIADHHLLEVSPPEGDTGAQ